MRIGIDMLAVQSPWSRLRGIGRLGHNLVSALLAHDNVNEYVMYGYEGLPADRIPPSSRARVVMLRQDPHRGEHTLLNVVDRLARTNPDGLDVLLFLSPMELYGGYSPPAKPLNGLKLAAVMHDVIPFLFQESYLNEAQYAIPVYRHLETQRQYDVLLANSDATRADFLRLLGLSKHQVVTIGVRQRRPVFHARPRRADAGGLGGGAARAGHRPPVRLQPGRHGRAERPQEPIRPDRRVPAAPRAAPAQPPARPELLHERPLHRPHPAVRRGAGRGRATGPDQ